MNAATGPVLVHAPVGRDTTVLLGLLSRAGIHSVACASRDELVASLGEGVGAVLLTDHVLVPAMVERLVAALALQPPWSDVPVVVLAAGDSDETMSPRRVGVRALRAAANVTVVARPVRAAYLVTTIEAALRARRRQFELRDALERERSARRDAERASHAKDDFLAAVSHELRTPLGAILLWSGMLASGDLPPAKVRRAIDAIGESARAQSQLIEDLLDVARMVSGKLDLAVRDTALTELFRAATTLVAPAAAAKDIQLDVDIAGDVGTAQVDPDRIQQVVTNLLGNAVKFTPRGGRVRLRASRTQGRLTIEVADTGIGIEPEFLPHVFERFRQADTSSRRAHGGLGLGLAISRELVELHGGTISVTSAGKDRGASFLVELPVSAGAPAHDDAKEDGAEPPSRRRALDGITVLVVEDDLAIRDAIAFALTERGAGVRVVDNGAAALGELARGNGARPHVILSDLAMPGMDGYELLDRIRKHEAANGDKPVPVAVVTARAAKTDRARALAAGFAEHLAKPFDADDLAALVGRLAR